MLVKDELLYNIFVKTSEVYTFLLEDLTRLVTCLYSLVMCLTPSLYLGHKGAHDL